MDDFFQPYRITWIVIGFLLLLKGIIAVIYLCCCRNSNRHRSTRSRTTDVLDHECGPSPMHMPYDPSVPGAPPSYDDLVKDGILNPAYDRETCEPHAANAAYDPNTCGPHAAHPLPPPATVSGLPAPPPYSIAVSHTPQETSGMTESTSPPSAVPTAPSAQPQGNDSQVPR